MKKRMLWRWVALLLSMVLCVPCLPAAANTAAVMDVVLVMDVSGSMSGAPLDVAKECAKGLVDRILTAQPNTWISVVQFDTHAKRLTYLDPITNKNALLNTIESMKATGSTNLTDGLSLAAADLKRHGRKGVPKCVVVLGDGIANTGLYTPVNEREKALYNEKTWGFDMTVFGSICVETAKKDLWPNAKVYSIGFFHKLGEVDKQRGYRLLCDIQNNGYFNADTPEALRPIFTLIGNDIVNPVLPNSLKLAPAEVTLKLQEKRTLVPTVLPENCTNKSVTYRSSDPGIATVNPLGRITAIKAGDCTIVGQTVNGITATTKVHILNQMGDPEKIDASPLPSTPSPDPELPTPIPTATASPSPTPAPIPPEGSEKLTGLWLTPVIMQLKTGEKQKIVVEPIPANAEIGSITWTSANPAVATVAADGTVTAVCPIPGDTRITAQVDGVTGSLTVNVKPTKPVFSGSTFALAIGNNQIKGDKYPVAGVKKALPIVTSMLKKKTQFSHVAELENRTTKQILEDISKTYAKATAKDTTLFYYCGPDKSGKKGSIGIKGADGTQLDFVTLRKALEKIPGKHVVILDMDHAGAFITQNADALKDRFLVMASCTEKQYASYVVREKESYNVFSSYLGTGIGGFADSDFNRILTLDELKAYIERNTKKLRMTPQIYPSSGVHPLFQLH